jgi:GTPase SAR1 family protein
VYDVSRRESFDNLKNWIQLYRENQSEESSTCVVAAKIDLLPEGTNPFREEAERLSKLEDMLHIEVSAKTGEGISKLFTDIVKKLCGPAKASGE